MKRLFSLLLLLLFTPSLSLAESSLASIPAGDTSSDLSLSYLSQLFGRVANVLPGHGSLMAGKLFMVLNQGILVICGIWLVYTIFNVFVAAATEGAFNSPQRKMTLIFLRLSAGVALLIPNANTGYSGIQDIVMEIVVSGVKLADQTWDYALNYLESGGSLYASPNSTKLSQADINKYMTAGNAPTATTGKQEAVKQIFMNEVCMLLGNNYMQQHPKDPLSHAGYPFHIIVDNAHYQLKFPGFGNTPPYDKSSEVPHCGSVAAYIPASKNPASSASVSQLSLAAISQIAYDLLPMAQRAVDRIDTSSIDTQASLADSTVFMNTVLDYINLIQPVAKYSVSKSTEAAKNFINGAIQQGWFSAGRFYWSLSQYNGALNTQLDYSNYIPSVTSYTPAALAPNTAAQIQGIYNQMFVVKNQKNPSNPDQKLSVFGVGKQLLLDYVNNHSDSKNAYSYQGENTWKTADVTPASGDSENAPGFDSTWVVIPTVRDGIKKVIETFYTLEQKSNQGFYDPLYFVMTLGKQCLGSAGYIWSHGAEVVGAIAGVSGVCQAMSPGATILQAFQSWFSSMITATALGLFVAGFMLTFYAPLYPYLLFLFGGISWIIYVIEAMIAAPLVCFGMTHPEGHDFLGRAEQALMLALGVFLRPVLMVIGFITAIMLSYITFAIVNYGFAQVLVEIFHPKLTTIYYTWTTQCDQYGCWQERHTHYRYHDMPQGMGVAPLNAIWGVVTGDASGNMHQGSHFTGHDLSDFMIIPLLMIFYGLIVIQVVNQCFSLIHVLPDMILRWIGGPIQQDASESYARQIQQSMSGAARQVGQTGGEAQVSAGAAIGSASGQTAGGIGKYMLG